MLKDLEKQDEGITAVNLASIVDDYAKPTYSDAKIRSKGDVYTFLRGSSCVYCIYQPTIIS